MNGKKKQYAKFGLCISVIDFIILYFFFFFSFDFQWCILQVFQDVCSVFFRLIFISTNLNSSKIFFTRESVFYVCSIGGGNMGILSFEQQCAVSIYVIWIFFSIKTIAFKKITMIFCLLENSFTYGFK